MRIDLLQTRRIEEGDDISVLFESLSTLEENSMVVVSAKVLSLCEGRVLDENQFEKIVESESDRIISQKGPFRLTEKNRIVIPNAGIDRSNAPNGKIILWPQDPFDSARRVFEFCAQKYNVKNIGLIVSDSCLLPRRKGALGIGIGWYGVNALVDKVGEKDLFGKTLTVTSENNIDGFASIADMLMGQGDMSTPIALFSDVPSKYFSQAEADPLALYMDPSQDLFEL